MSLTPGYFEIFHEKWWYCASIGRFLTITHRNGLFSFSKRQRRNWFILFESAINYFPMLERRSYVKRCLTRVGEEQVGNYLPRKGEMGCRDSKRESVPEWFTAETLTASQSRQGPEVLPYDFDRSRWFTASLFSVGGFSAANSSIGLTTPVPLPAGCWVGKRISEIVLGLHIFSQLSCLGNNVVN